MSLDQVYVYQKIIYLLLIELDVNKLIYPTTHPPIFWLKIGTPVNNDDFLIHIYIIFSWRFKLLWDKGVQDLPQCLFKTLMGIKFIFS